MVKRCLKQKAIVWAIELIEWTINNARMMNVLCFVVRMYGKTLDLIHRIMGAAFHSTKAISEDVCRSGRSPGSSGFNIFKNMNAAFICDGNRRYVKKLGLRDDFVREEGLRKIYEFVDFGYRYCLREVSFFCFALKNFKRSKDEVDGLMRIVRDRNPRTEKNTRLKARFRVYGRLDLLEEDVKNELTRLEEETKDNSDIIVNVFFAYSAEDEISRGVSFNSHVDILIRTGGVKRLSDFMLRQVSKGTDVFFADVLWPELTATHLYLIFLKHRLENKYLLN